MFISRPLYAGSTVDLHQVAGIEGVASAHYISAEIALDYGLLEYSYGIILL